MAGGAPGPLWAEVYDAHHIHVDPGPAVKARGMTAEAA